MSPFDAGFLKVAEEYGLTSNEATQLLKRAFEHPETSHMFKNLDDDTVEDPNEMADLAAMLQQELIDKHMSAAKHQIQM